MIDTSTTTTLLLDSLHDPANSSAWREFDARYRPIIVALARKLGLGVEDAADCAQESLLQFLTAYREGKYERGRGRPRSWLLGIVKYRISDFKKRRAAAAMRRGTSGMMDIPADDVMFALWEQEHKRQILRRALDELRRSTRTQPKTIDAFELLMWEDKHPTVIAEQLNMTVDDVYVAKHRMIERLRTIVTQLEIAFAEVP